MTIDEILEITNIVANIDGEDVYILENGRFRELEKLRNRIKTEKENHLFAMLSKDIEFICSHSGFAIAFRPVKWGDAIKWIPCLVYKYKDEWRRVILQYANCLKCDWNGSIANPTEPDLYITLENRFDILKKMNQLPFCKCPKCGNEISSKAIWTENGKE